jgi:lipopolysaccharide/colanic/teichoic acid biosynthesis glycosyltransferase
MSAVHAAPARRIDRPVAVPLPRAPARPAWMRATKRAFDVAAALGALVVTAPVVLIAMAAIVAVDRGSPIFRHERIGRDGRPFMMFKLRTMVHGAHAMLPELRRYSEVDGPVFKMRDDPRLHPLGAFLRRTSIDELPNFLNVLRGEMSVVGPRPPLPDEVAHYDAYAMRRLCVKPGITCLWQISGRSQLSFDEWMALDNRYIDTWTPAVDLEIVLRTIPAVLRGNGAH